MRPYLLTALLSISALALSPGPAMAWGHTAHSVIDRAAIEAIPDTGPTFLRKYADYIAFSVPLPVTWRGNSENFSKMAEDPNHGWFREQFTFVKPIPRSRHEFMLELYKQHVKIKDSDPETAARTNIRWTGTLPYAAIEAYDRLIVCMRQIRKAQAEGRDASAVDRGRADQGPDSARPISRLRDHVGRLPDRANRQDAGHEGHGHLCWWKAGLSRP